MDGRKNNGGVRTGAGRPAKADEQKLIEKLTPLAPLAFKALQTALEENEGWAVKMFFEYSFGKPRQQMDITTGGQEVNINPITWVVTQNINESEQ